MITFFSCSSHCAITFHSVPSRYDDHQRFLGPSMLRVARGWLSASTVHSLTSRGALTFTSDLRPLFTFMRYRSTLSGLRSFAVTSTSSSVPLMPPMMFV